MQKVKVMDFFKIGENTAVIVKSKGEGFKNGVIIFDDKGVSYNVLSVGMININSDYISKSSDTTALLVEGDFESSKIYLQ